MANMQMTGDVALLAKLHSLPIKIQKKYSRRAMTKAGRVVIAATKPHVPVLYGALEESIGQRGKTYGSTVITVIGARTGFDWVDENGNKHDPAKVAHLVEMGHGGPHAAGPHPFLRPGYDSTKGQCQVIIGAEIALGIEAEGI
jgi:HK97 gp10 family phage protein